MNIKELAKTIKREITDPFKGIDSNPEHIAAFSAHAPSCSRTMPLVLETELKVTPAAWNSSASLIVVGETCPECKGTVSFKK